MSKRFNPPPNWPAPPAGFRPLPGWQPDPSWPPPPPGWELWIEDGKAHWFAQYKLPIGLGCLGVGFALLVLIGIIAAIVGTDTTAPTQPRTAVKPPAEANPPEEPTISSSAGPQSPTSAATPPPERSATTSPKSKGVKAIEPKSTTSTSRRTASTPQRTTSKPKSTSVYYVNCSAARAAGAVPLYRGEPGYRSGLDRDDDGVACE